MKHPTPAACRRSIATAAALMIAGGVCAVSTASAENSSVAAVTGSAYGYFTNVSLFGGPSDVRGPASTTGCDDTTTAACSPSATLPPAGGDETVTDVDGAAAQYGPAVIFASNSMSAKTQGALGDGTSVTSSSSASDVGQGPFSATLISSTCTADATSVAASVAVSNGELVTRTDPSSGEPVGTVKIDANPVPNSVYTGTLDHVGDSFKAVANEQIVHPDGSITVNAFHLFLLGPIAVGDLIVGQSVCGVASATANGAPKPATTASSPLPTQDDRAPQLESASAVAADAPLTSNVGVDSGAPVARSAALSTAPLAGASVPTQAAGQTGPGAFGYFTNVGLFGGPQNPRGPAPTVNLPAGGSATPVTDTIPSADARYGPGIIFTSEAITVSTQGMTDSVTSKVNIGRLNTSDQEVLNATSVASTCTGRTGSTTIAGGTLRVSEGTDLDSDTDDTVVPVPANPPPNTRITGKIETVGDAYTYIFNEQILDEATGTFTVNAGHQILEGPTAIGELIFGQVRCVGGGTGGTGGTGGGGTGGTGTGGTGTGGTSGTGTGGSGGTGTGGTGSRSTGRSSMASTGFGTVGPLVLALGLFALGASASVGGARLRPASRARRGPHERP